MEEQLFSAGQAANELQQAVEKIKEEAAKILVGQERMVDLILAAILSDGHILIEGVPGIAKTLTSKIIARTIDVGFSRIQFTPDLMPSDVLGTSVFNTKTNEFEFKSGPIFSNVILIDEINRAPAKTQAALFEVMEEKQVTVDGTTYPMSKPFIVLATQNPIEQEGTYKLPEAQLDRFIFKIDVSYPDLADEKMILHGFQQRKSHTDLSSINPVITAEQLETYKQTVQNIHVEENLVNYIAELVHSTRNNSALYLGASPRASLAILNGSKALAVMRGRDFVTPEDIKEVVFPVLTHRIILTPEKEIEGVTPRDIIKSMIEKIEVPR